MPMRLAVAVTFALLAISATPVSAQSCTFGIGAIDFGSVDILSGAEVNGTATLSITCNGLPLNTVRVCASLGAGSGGSSPPIRRLQGPSATLNFQLYQNSGRTISWGSNHVAGFGFPPTIDVPLGLGGAGNANVTIYTRLTGSQQTSPAGSYAANFTAASSIMDYGYTFLGIVGCDAVPLLNRVGTATFMVSAEIEKTCIMTAQDIDFGSHGLLSSNFDSDGQLSLTCTNDTPYTISLDGGSAGGGPLARTMRKGSEQVTYGIFRDPGRTQPWGSTTGTTASGSGAGAAVQMGTFGRVPPQATPSPGIYTDSVIATVAY